MIFFYNPEPLDEYEPTLVAVDADSVDDAADVAGIYTKLIYFEAELEPPRGMIIDGLFVPEHGMYGYKNIGDVWKRPRTEE